MLVKMDYYLYSSNIKCLSITYLPPDETLVLNVLQSFRDDLFNLNCDFFKSSIIFLSYDITLL